MGLPAGGLGGPVGQAWGAGGLEMGWKNAVMVWGWTMGRMSGVGPCPS